MTLLTARCEDLGATVMDRPAAFAAVRANPAFLPFALNTRPAAQAALGLTTEVQRLLSREEAALVLHGL
ncbi:hypothetical protein [Pelagibius sp.]|uniref:hypothetical protein n=1 Tax=Pelagibius sp. TaxID=1931238 RepID=UPI003B511F45